MEINQNVCTYSDIVVMDMTTINKYFPGHKLMPQMSPLLNDAQFLTKTKN